MQLRISSVLFLLVFLASFLGAQWVEFNDETGTRLNLTSVTNPDTEEKDIAVGDLNNDGWTDVVIARKLPFSNPGAATDILLINQNGVLVDQTVTHAPGFITVPTDARDLIVADFDGDGWEDVLFANTFQQQPVYHENLGADSSGNWLGLAEASATHLPFVNVPDLQICAAWAGDVTGNGALDVYMSNYVESGGPAQDVLLINDGNGVFTDETAARLGDLRNSAFGTSVEIADMDGDGDQDIVKMTTLYNVPPFNDLGTYVLFNDGTGNFSVYDEVPSADPYMHHLADLNNDGQVDVYVVDDAQDYVNMSDTYIVDTEITFDRTTLSDSPGTTNFGGNVKSTDIDNDGDLDIGVADVDVDIPPCNSSRRFRMLENEGLHSGTISDPNSGVNEAWNLNTFDFQFIDIDNDGKMDMFMGGCEWYSVWMQPGDSLPAVSVDLTLQSQFGGATIDYSVLFSNTTASNQQTDVWARIAGPNNYKDLMFVKNLNIPASGQRFKATNYTITGPDLGSYNITLYAGTYPNQVDVSESLTYNRTAALTESGNVASSTVPERTHLVGNYPNPFNPTTVINYGLAETSDVQLTIFDALGREVRQLVSGSVEAGYHEVVWDGKNATGESVTSGIYIYRLTAGSTVESKQMLLNR